MNYNKIVDDAYFSAAAIDVPITIAMGIASNLLANNPVAWKIQAGIIATKVVYAASAAVFGNMVNNAANEYFDNSHYGKYVFNALGGALKYGMKGDWQLSEMVKGAVNYFSYNYLKADDYYGEMNKVFYIEAIQEEWFFGYAALLIDNADVPYELTLTKSVVMSVPSLVISASINIQDYYNDDLDQEQQELAFTIDEL